MASTFISLPKYKTSISGQPISIVFGGQQSNSYNEISSVANSLSFTTILTYTAATAVKLKLVSAGGTNVAEYRITLNGTPISKRYTYFGASLHTSFDFKEGIQLVPSDVIAVQVRHNRPFVGDFNANLLTEV